MLDDDPRRVGHRLTLGRRARGLGVVTVGWCECGAAAARWHTPVSPGKGGLTRIRHAHDRHIEEVEGPPVPVLTRPQVEALLSYDDRLRALSAGRRVTLEVLGRFGLAVCAPSGVWVPTEAGQRVIRVLRRARAA